MPSAVFVPALNPPSWQSPFGIAGDWQGVPQVGFAPLRAIFERSPGVFHSSASRAPFYGMLYRFSVPFSSRWQMLRVLAYLVDRLLHDRSGHSAVERMSVPDVSPGNLRNELIAAPGGQTHKEK